MKYQLISAPSKFIFEELINRYLADGWVLYGNVVLSHESTYTKYYQAMTKQYDTSTTKS